MSAEDYISPQRQPERLVNLPAPLSWRPVPLLTGAEGCEGMLVFWAEQLIAVLGQVELRRRGVAHRWHLEVGFGECAAPPSGMVFQSLAHALRWLAERCNGTGATAEA